MHGQCEADLPTSLRFGKTVVSCEGWDYAGDDHVLKGACVSLFFQVVVRISDIYAYM